jgi:hypothetical protein
MEAIKRTFQRCKAEGRVSILCVPHSPELNTVDSVPIVGAHNG